MLVAGAALALARAGDKAGEGRVPSSASPKTAATPEAKPLTADEQTRFEAGKELYAITCAACHQPNGLGQEGLAPPLAGSVWVTGSPERLVRMILHGVRGPITVKGKLYQIMQEMPPLGVFENQQIAQVLTYVRREWGHTALPITVEFVAKIRAETETRDEAWSEADLLKIPEPR